VHEQNRTMVRNRNGGGRGGRGWDLWQSALHLGIQKEVLIEQYSADYKMLYRGKERREKIECFSANVCAECCSM
jgi:hypothetical protein